MPEMTDAMYCHQQICIPPTFPYLLRQYAKAAIRTQPADLLRWSAAYFRALAIGVPAPVKPRLEYPILKTHYGLTSGWLKTLLRQFVGYEHVTWPQLYDRWRGACLEVRGLVELVTMGQFQEPANIPWIRFVAIAAAHLTKNLTSTMVLICELLTEEPEGGSATIPYPTFSDLYRYLAHIDASEEKTVANFYFTESNLELTKRSQPEEGESVTLSAEQLPEERSDELDSRTKTALERYLEVTVYQSVQDEHEEEKLHPSLADVHTLEDDSKPEAQKSDSDASCYVILDPSSPSICKEKHPKTSSSSSGSTDHSSDDVHMISRTSKEFEDEGPVNAEDASFHDVVVSKESGQVTKSSEITESRETYNEVELPVVPGIGPTVPIEVVNAALDYLQEVASRQEGMVMPRNLRHFLCPPLEKCQNN